MKTVLCATDLSPGATPVFRAAVRHAQGFGAELVLVHVLEELGSFAQTLLEAYLDNAARRRLETEGFERAREIINERLERFCESEKESCPGGELPVSRILVVKGPAAKAIVKQADEQQADLIVMGKHSLSSLGEIFLGSTARRVAQLAKIPVLLVPVERRSIARED